MARPFSFVPDTVLERAMVHFWIHGYAGTSLKALTTALEIHPGSLYRQFGSKSALFQECIKRYSAFRIDRVPRDADAKDKVMHWLQSAVPTAGEDHPAGCLLVGTYTERALLEPELQAVLDQHLAGVEGFFAGQCAALGFDDAKARGRQLMALNIGIFVLAKGGASKKSLAPIFAAAESILTPTS